MDTALNPSYGYCPEPKLWIYMGDLAIQRYNEVRDAIGDLASFAFGNLYSVYMYLIIVKFKYKFCGCCNALTKKTRNINNDEIKELL